MTRAWSSEFVPRERAWGPGWYARKTTRMEVGVETLLVMSGAGTSRDTIALALTPTIAMPGVVRVTKPVSMTLSTAVGMVGKPVGKAAFSAAVTPSAAMSAKHLVTTTLPLVINDSIAMAGVRGPNFRTLLVEIIDSIGMVGGERYARTLDLILSTALAMSATPPVYARDFQIKTGTDILMSGAGTSVAAFSVEVADAIAMAGREAYRRRLQIGGKLEEALDPYFEDPSGNAVSLGPGATRVTEWSKPGTPGIYSAKLDPAAAAGNSYVAVTMWTGSIYATDTYVGETWTISFTAYAPPSNTAPVSIYQHYSVDVNGANAIYPVATPANSPDIAPGQILDITYSVTVPTGAAFNRIRLTPMLRSAYAGQVVHLDDFHIERSDPQLQHYGTALAIGMSTGTAYTRTLDLVLNDSIGMAVRSTSVAAFQAILNDVIAMTAKHLVTTTLPLALSPSIGMTARELYTRTLPFTINDTISMAAVESYARAFLVEVADAIGMSVTSTSVAAFQAILNDTITMAGREAYTRTLPLVLTPSVSMAGREAYARTLPLALSVSVTMTSGQLALASFSVVVNDTVGMAGREAYTRTLPLVLTPAVGMAGREAYGRTVDLAVTPALSMGATAGANPPAAFSIEVLDVITMTGQARPAPLTEVNVARTNQPIDPGYRQYRVRLLGGGGTGGAPRVQSGANCPGGGGAGGGGYLDTGWRDIAELGGAYTSGAVAQSGGVGQTAVFNAASGLSYNAYGGQPGQSWSSGTGQLLGGAGGNVLVSGPGGGIEVSETGGAGGAGGNTSNNAGRNGASTTYAGPGGGGGAYQQNNLTSRSGGDGGSSSAASGGVHSDYNAGPNGAASSVDGVAGGGGAGGAKNSNQTRGGGDGGDRGGGGGGASGGSTGAILRGSGAWASNIVEFR